MIYVHLAEGFEEIEALTVVDVLRRADLQVNTISMEKTLEVKGAHEILVKADIMFSQADYKICEMIVLPGGMPGTSNLMNNEDLGKKVLEFNQGGKYLAAICAGPMIFGELGILADKKATIYPGMESHLKQGDYKDIPVVVDGNIITSQGPATAMNFALELVGILKGSDGKKEVAKGLLFKEV
ncbi:MAG: DJ-1/PfpI family protein [Anaerovoracaceae bacterium]|jgi:4-methyl-5(b-hydroxyethyl)-thiazole monophosphate biosynthesis|nr:DJ-1/PfpI family protein [Anaerovoracaceae bacterium]